MAKNLELVCRMIRKGVTQAELGKRLGRADGYVGARMHGHRPWTLDEVYAICDCLEIPYEEIPFYFPKGVA